MATGGQSEEIVKRINANLECSICMETYTDPRILDCLHSFCFKCIRTHVGNSTIIKCPLCNIESPVPVDSGIESLKSNFFIKGLINDMMHQKEDNKVESVPSVCGCCDLDNTAKAHCDDCDCELCDQCIQQHRQLKVFKLHKFTLYPTDEEIKVRKDATDIQNNIAANISELQAKISQLQSKIDVFSNERDTTTSQINQAYQRFLKEVEKYVQVLTTRIKENAEKKLGNLPNKLKVYETQLTTYQTLEKQQQCMFDLDLDEKIKLCKELQEQIEKLKVKIAESGPLSSCYLPKVQFVPKNTGLEMAPLLEQAIGFLTPIKSRYERSAFSFNRKGMSNKMKDYAVDCAHIALDIYGIHQSTPKILDDMAKDIRVRYSQRYNRGKWSCYVVQTCRRGFCVFWKKFLSINIDGYHIILMEESD